MRDEDRLLSTAEFEDILADTKEQLLKRKSTANVSVESEGADQYEPNDMPSNATYGLENRIVYANIHDESDVSDW